MERSAFIRHYFLPFGACAIGLMIYVNGGVDGQSNALCLGDLKRAMSLLREEISVIQVVRIQGAVTCRHWCSMSCLAVSAGI
ncbi:hypothetical protein [Dyella sp. 20L07]|uniref:hypothetical protein n=1 Tax=Dyella sp. 20L07 TaxID=3384240 RepID=UPI003D290763